MPFRSCEMLKLAYFTEKMENYAYLFKNICETVTLPASLFALHTEIRENGGSRGAVVNASEC